MLNGLLTLALATSLQAAPALLVSPSWLAEHLSDPNLVLLHVGPRPDYDAKHIPGARYAGYNTDLAVREGDAATGLTLQMPQPDVLRERLASLGVSDNSRIIVSFSGGSVSPSTRVLQTLRYAGFENAALLDGGLAAWERENRPVTTDVPPARQGTLSALKTKPVVVDAAFVGSHVRKSGFVVVDARLPAFYDGVQTGGNAQRQHLTGHIAGAVNVPFETLFRTDDQKFKSREDLAAIFANAGIKKDDTVVVYCHIGQQATVVIFAARLLGFNAVLYDGSFEDWSLRKLPVEKTPR